MRISPLVCLMPLVAFTLVGCFQSPIGGAPAEPGVVLHGSVHSGAAPIAGAHIYLLAANDQGYNQASLPMLDPQYTPEADSLSGYAVSGANGNFTLPAAYFCSTERQIYVLALGGHLPGQPNNAATGLMTVIGHCPNVSDALTAPFLTINEASTVAAAYAMAGFAENSLYVSSPGNLRAQTGITNAFANAANLVHDGIPLTLTPAGNGAVPQPLVNAVADMLAACVDSDSAASDACGTLFAATSSHGILPTDTASAAINIAHNPGTNVASLFSLVGPSSPYLPTPPTVPNDLTLSIVFSGGGLAGPSSLAVDAQGDVWATNLDTNTLTELAPNGSPLSPITGYLGVLSAPIGVAIDLAGNAWVADAITSTIAEFNPSGLLISPLPFGYSGGGLQVPGGIAADANGHVWVANYANSLSELSGAGGFSLAPSTGFTGGGLNGPAALAVDNSGNVWVANSNPNAPGSLSKFSSAGAPLSPSTGFTGGGLNHPLSVAIDREGSAWATNLNGSSLTVLSSSGTPLSPAAGWTGGGLDEPFAVAIDGAGKAWAANFGSSTVSVFDCKGTPLSPPTGYGKSSLYRPQALAIDGSGDVWVANTFALTLTEMIGAAAPVVTPSAAALKDHALGARP